MVDDNEISLKLADILFRRSDYEVDLAESGAKAIEKALQSKYDLILMDIEMPGINGIEAMREIKKALGDAAPPVVALTAHSMEDQKRELLTEGMDDFLSKPLKLEAIQNLIDRVL